MQTTTATNKWVKKHQTPKIQPNQDKQQETKHPQPQPLPLVFFKKSA